jgi:hypothetical protein
MFSRHLLYLCATIAALALLIGCDWEADDPTDGDTTGPDAGCPLDPAACAFAVQLAGWVAAGDVDAILAQSAPRDYTCQGPDPEDGLGRPYSVCNGVPAGEHRPGYPVGRLNSDAGAISPEHFREEVAGWLRWAHSADGEATDAFGDGRLRLISLGCPLILDGVPQPAGEDACGEQFVAVFSGLYWTGPVRSLFRGAGIFLVRQAAVQPPRIIGFVQGGLLDESDIAAVLGGGSENVFVMPLAPGAPVFGTFLPWSLPAGKDTPRRDVP